MSGIVVSVLSTHDYRTPFTIHVNPSMVTAVVREPGDRPYILVGAAFYQLAEPMEDVLVRLGWG